jgi:hypothetical protein
MGQLCSLSAACSTRILSTRSATASGGKPANEVRGDIGGGDGVRIGP